MDERTVKCPLCGEPYKAYAFFAGDQSACPECRGKAERNKGRAASADKLIWNPEG